MLCSLNFLPNATRDWSLLTIAFKAEAGQDNDPVQAKSGAYYVVKVAGVTEGCYLHAIGISDQLSNFHAVAIQDDTIVDEIAW